MLTASAIVWLPCVLWMSGRSHVSDRAGFAVDIFVRLAVLAIPAYCIGRLVASVGISPADHLRRLQRQRVDTGHCPHRDYDVRAMPGRCPECGWDGGTPDSAAASR